MYLPFVAINAKRGVKFRERREQICELYKSGLSQSEIASRLNTAPSFIGRVLQRHNVQTRSPKEGAALRAKRDERLALIAASAQRVQAILAKRSARVDVELEEFDVSYFDDAPVMGMADLEWV